MAKMISLDTIANSLAQLLKDFSAEISHSPEFELKDLAKKRCVIVPISYQQKNLCRNKKILEISSTLEIGLLARGKNLDISKLIAQVKEISQRCLRFKVNTAVCVAVDLDPLYDQEQLRQRNQFTSVMALTFKEIVHDS